MVRHNINENLPHYQRNSKHKWSWETELVHDIHVLHHLRQDERRLCEPSGEQYAHGWFAGRLWFVLGPRPFGLWNRVVSGLGFLMLGFIDGHVYFEP